MNYSVVTIDCNYKLCIYTQNRDDRLVSYVISEFNVENVIPLIDYNDGINNNDNNIWLMIITDIGITFKKRNEVSEFIDIANPMLSDNIIECINFGREIIAYSFH